MERLIEMLGTLALLYAGYALSVKKWDYSSEAQREKRQTELKRLGLANTFYFINARTQFLLTLLSGGLFSFYWMYQQWKAVLHGFKRSDGKPLKGGALVRAAGGFYFFFRLAGIINRTCEYMRHKTALPAGVWGCLWLAGLICALAPLAPSARIAGYLIFCAAPAAYQRRLNVLVKNPLPGKPKMTELIAAALGLLCTLAAAAVIRANGLRF